MRHYRVTVEDVIAAHKEALTYGGLSGIVSMDGIKSAIGRPYSGYYRSLSKKAAAIMQALAQNHGFVDGNKRTAFLVTDLLIRRSGHRLVLAPHERIDDIIVGVVKHEISFENLVDWFTSHLQKT